MRRRRRGEGGRRREEEEGGAHLGVVGLLLAEDRLALVEQRALLLRGLQLVPQNPPHLRRHLLRPRDVLVLAEAGDHLVELLEALAEGLLLGSSSGLHRHRVLLAQRGVPLGDELALLVDPLRPRQGAPERLRHLVGHQVLPPLEHRAVVHEFLQALLQLGQGDVEAGHVPAGGSSGAVRRGRGRRGAAPSLGSSHVTVTPRAPPPPRRSSASCAAPAQSPGIAP